MRTPLAPGRVVLVAALLVVSTVLPATALDMSLESGLDVWVTRADGSTFFSFAEDPLPADFFCSGSEPFTGKIVFEGVPVATFPEDALGGSDTILQRLDPAVFNEKGVATTRLQIRALHFQGIELLETWCGDYRVEVMLDGEQPVTEMRIYRLNPRGGVFEAEVAVNAKLVFTPVGHKGEVLEIPRSVVFPPRPNSVWASRPGEKGVDHEGFAVIDTNADGQPDTFVPGTSRNFAAGWPSIPEHEALLHGGSPGLNGSGAGIFSDNGGLLDSPALEACGETCHCDAGCGNHCLCPPLTICTDP